jgi:hypothetical protein
LSPPCAYPEFDGQDWWRPQWVLRHSISRKSFAFLQQLKIHENICLTKIVWSINKKRIPKMVTAKKAAPKAAKSTPKATKTAAPKPASKAAAKAPAKKAVVSKAAKAIAKLTAKIAQLTERKNKVSAEITALKDQRSALKAPPVAAPATAPVATEAPAKKAKAAVKK